MANNSEIPVNVSNIKALKSEIDTSIESCVEKTDLDSRNLEYDSTGLLGLADECVDGTTISLNESRALTIGSQATAGIPLTLTGILNGNAYLTRMTNYYNYTSSGVYFSAGFDVSDTTTTTISAAFESCGTLTGIYMGALTSIPYNAFANCGIQYAIFPKVSVMSSSAFYSCTGLALASFEVLESVPSMAFPGCVNLATAIFPAATSVHNGAFNGCINLTKAIFPKLSAIYSSTFASCKNLTTISFPAATTVGAYAFQSCANLTTASFPAATKVNSYAFKDCTNLTTVSLPAATVVGEYAFSNCTQLEYVYTKSLSEIKSHAFHLVDTASMSNLKNLSIYFDSSSVVTFVAATGGSYFFPLGSYLKIYVPSSLYSQYLTADTWKAMYSSYLYSF